MIFTIILFISALLISAVAGYFSIVGLTLIFSGSPLAIALMGISLEIGKLVTASFVYKNWEKINVVLKSYFVISVVVLSIITSMGIFGYLSKSYISESASIYGQEIELKTKEDLLKIEQARLKEYIEQKEKRNQPNRRIERSIDEAQLRIIDLTREIGELKSQKSSLSVEIGPIRYISELIYGENSMETIDRAVRLVIILLIFVFDPLAISLVIAANMQQSFNKTPQIKKNGSILEIDETAVFNIENEVRNNINIENIEKRNNHG